MTLIFYLVTGCFLAALPAFNGYTSIACLFFILVLLSPIKVLVAQGIAILLWILWYGRADGPPLILDEYYLYLLNAFIFILGAPFYISHRRQPQEPWMRFFLVPIRYILLTLAVFLLLSTLLRSYPLSNAVWAIACFIYGYFLPCWKIRIRLSSTMGYVILFTLMTITTLLFVEIGARLFLVAPPPPGGHYMPHAEAIFTMCPNSSGPFILKNNDGDTISPNMTVSSQGIRDREYGPKPPDTFRIVMLGDSFTMGSGLESNETIDSVLETLLQKTDISCDIQVINCGVGGYAPWQERIFLQERGFSFEPDLVILQLFPANDVAGSYSKVEKYLDAINEEWEYQIIHFNRQNEWPFRIERICKQKSSGYRLLLAAINSQGIIRPAISDFRLFPAASYPIVVSQSNRPPNMEVCLKEWYPGLEEAWGIYADSIRGIRDDCLEEGVDLIAYAHSDKISLCPPSKWEKLKERFPDTPYEINKDIRLTNELLEALDVPSIDVFSALKKYPVEDVHYIYDGHFTPKGAEVVATCLRDYLLEHYFSERLLMKEERP
jgi:hypothetical protein